MAKVDMLEELANNQGGYFTAKQALELGYSYPNQHYHTQRGNWTKESRGIYRLPYWPLPLRPDLILLTLMSADRSGLPQAVVSHESALSIHNLSDANPERVHLTVPPGFRVKMPQDVVLHKRFLLEIDRDEHEGFSVTTPLRTIIDVAETPSLWPYLPDAIYDALEKGLVRPSQLVRASVDEKTWGWIISAMGAAEERMQRKVKS